MNNFKNFTEDCHIKHVRDYSLLWWGAWIGAGLLGAVIFWGTCQFLPFLLGWIMGM